MALFDEDFSISPARVGSAILRRLALTGWGNTPTIMEQGRLYWRVTSNGASSTLKLYRSAPNAAGSWTSADEMASGTFTIDADNFVAVTLSQANASGLSGTCLVKASADSRGDVIVTYCDEQDIKRALHDSASLLTSSQFEGETRFEGVMKQAKREIDRWLRTGQRPQFPSKSTSGEVDLSILAAPRQLADCHAQLSVALLWENQLSQKIERLEDVKHWRRRAMDTFQATAPSLDYLLDGFLNGELRTSSVSLVRG